MSRWENFAAAGGIKVEMSGSGAPLPEMKVASQGYSMGSGAAGTTVIRKPSGP